MKKAADTIPPQETGGHTDFGENKEFKTSKAAHDAFKKAAERLLTVNEWHNYAGPGSSRFCLTNNLGEDVTGYAKEGLFFNIELPVPGSNAGDGLEWVMIERIELKGNNRDEEEYIYH